MKAKLIIVLLMLLCVTPVCAAVEYPQGYYMLGDQTNISWQKISGAYYGDGREYPTVGYLTFIELRRQNILLEKQNELQSELVKAQWVETCYTPQKNMNMGNYTAWKFECANAGYPVG